MKKERISQLLEIVAKNNKLMLDAERHIWKNPETGYREWKTSKYMADEFTKLGYELVFAGNIPGFYCDLDTGRPGPKLLIMGELDSLLVTTHPECDPDTGYVHACGHHAQAAALLGIAAALKQPHALDDMCGSIRLMAVPAEELIEIGFREGLRQQGVIKYFGGKVEFMHRGFMQDCDIALLVHTAALDKPGIGIDIGSNGCVTKNIQFVGVSAHAGGSPDKGINALYAASNALQACNALRETFREVDFTRFHPIITKGGGAVNAIPNDVLVESYVRGATVEAIASVNKRINRALAGSAAAMGANVVIHDRPGYTPLHNDKLLNKIAGEVVTQAFGQQALTVEDEWGTGCTDMGDVSMVMPTVQPMCSGACGAAHGSDYGISDPNAAVCVSAQFQVLMAQALLEENGKLALQVIEQGKKNCLPVREFLDSLDKVFMDKTAVIYNEDGSIKLDYCN